MAINYRICTKCVMDTTDPDIYFNEKGVCNHCTGFSKSAEVGQFGNIEWFPNEIGANKLNKIAGNIIKGRGNRKYDCIMGISGGVDSCFLALKVKELGLNPLVVHVDTGWNSELAVWNIEKVIKYCNFDLYTHVVDWDEMRDLQLAYLKAAVANQDVPQDHVIFAVLWKTAAKHGIKYFLSGGNQATECIFPKAWHGPALDKINLLSIHKKFGDSSLKTYTTISFFERYIWYPIINRLKIIRPLNYMEYNKEKAIIELEQIGWRSYGRKHGESIFTKFFQNYYLPVKFGYDKRRPHLSSLIVNGQLSREDAIEKINEPLYNKEELEVDISFFCKKLRISKQEFDDIMEIIPHDYKDFPTWDKYFNFGQQIQVVLKNWKSK